jgi:hypothetical protein
MAQKKITDQPLIAALVDSANFIVDTGILTYRTTAVQLMTYIYTKLNALSQVTPLAADFVLGFDASDSNAAKKFSLSRFKNAVYRAVVTTDSVGVDDDTMVLSGASFTSTLPTAVGVAGKRYKFLHAGTSFSQVYTLATTSSQTIGGVAGGSYALYTAGECLEIESDGANWIIVGRVSNSNWVSYTPTITGFGTPTSIDFYWRRQGTDLLFRGIYTSSSGTATEARVSLPATSVSTLAALQTCGVYLANNAATANKGGPLFIEPSVAYVTFSQSSTYGSGSITPVTKANANGITTGAIGFVMNGQVPISGWQP